MADLFVIEAPGKARGLEATLESIGLSARVRATKGHLYSMPERLSSLGVDRGFRDFGRTLADRSIAERIRAEAVECDRVLIATDADQEGDVIAWDVAELISDIRPDPLRVRLRGMDVDSVREAVAGATAVSRLDAVPGRTRAIVDRMIGAVFSHEGVAVGRIGTALLGLVDSSSPVTRQLRLVAPSKDGGRPWVATCDVRPPLDEAMARRLADIDLPALEFKAATAEASRPPGNMGDVMVRAGDLLDMAPKEADRSLQRLYEAGRMSYPRAGSRGLSKGTVSKIARVLKQAGFRFEEDAVATKDATDVHDAPYPIGRVDVSRDPTRQGQEEGLRTMVARDLVRSGQRHVAQYASADRLAGFLAAKGFPGNVAEMVARLHWRREEGPRYPGQETWPDSAVITRRADTVLLERAMEAGLGRPSTWAAHIDTFMQRKLVNEDLGITAKGDEWIRQSPVALLDPRISAYIERACETDPKALLSDPDREPWEVLAEAIVRKLPDELRRPLQASVSSVPRHSRANPIEPFIETIGLDEALERRRERRHEYAPAPRPAS